MPSRRRSYPRTPKRRSSRSPRGASSGPGWLVLLLVALVLGVLGWAFRDRWRETLSGPVAAAPEPVRPVAAAEPVARIPNPAPLPTPVFTPPPRPEPMLAEEPGGYPRVVVNLLEAQIALARRHLSSGAIDGVAGAQTAAALAAFQESAGLPTTGQFDAATRARLVLRHPAFATHVLTPEDFAGLRPVPPTWLGKSESPALDHETLLERLAERSQAHPNLLRRLNPAVVWESLTPGAALNLPAVEREELTAPVAHLHVRLAARALQARATDGTLLVHFPVSIAKRVDKRPVGALRIVVVVPDPNYTFDPAVFTESAEARELGRKLILAPGPNNPVGVAWIGLDRPGYGIHGTPTPELVGRTESHGCFRLANWDARALLDLVSTGLPIYVEP